MDGDLETRFQAPKRVGPPIKNQGSSRVDSLQALGYYKIMNKKEAKEITGGLSAPGKMPEGSYNLPARACQTGAKLRQIPGTPCYGCYAFKGRYNFPNVKDALTRRLESLDHPQWVEAMATLVKGKKHFRWHDSGDIQSVPDWREAAQDPGHPVLGLLCIQGPLQFFQC